MQLVVVMAVRAAVTAATMTFRMISQMFLFFIMVIMVIGYRLLVIAGV